MWLMIIRVLSTNQIWADLRISRIKEDEKDVKLLYEMPENHYRYSLAYNVGNLYIDWKQSKSVAKKFFWKLIKIFLITQTGQLNIKEVFTIFTTVPQLDKCPKFMAFEGVILHRIQSFLFPQ